MKGTDVLFQCRMKIMRVFAGVVRRSEAPVSTIATTYAIEWDMHAEIELLCAEMERPTVTSAHRHGSSTLKA